MPAEQKIDRVTVVISKETHKKHSTIAELLGLNLKEATEEAVSQWNDRNAARAQRKAAESLKPAA